MCTKCFQCAAATATPWRFGLPDSGTSLCQISARSDTRGDRQSDPANGSPRRAIPGGSSLLCEQGHSPFLPHRQRPRRTTHNPTAPLSRINAVLGSGVVVTAPGVTTIVSTKKSHPWVPAFGVVIVTEVIGSAGSV